MYTSEIRHWRGIFLKKISKFKKKERNKNQRYIVIEAYCWLYNSNNFLKMEKFHKKKKIIGNKK